MPDVEKAIDGQDAVISVLGNKTSHALWQSDTTISDGLKNILTGMKKHKVKRLLFVTSFGVSNNIFFPEKLFIRAILKNIFADISRQEMLIKASDLDYTIVRPARLTNGARTGKYKVGVDLPIGIASQISRGDVADFLLKSIDDKSTTKKVITVCY